MMSQRQKVILVTGGSGCFGSSLLAKLRIAGLRVRVFDLVDADDRPADVEFMGGDIRDRGAVARACRGVACVYHNVAQVPLAKDKDLFESVNIRGTENLLRVAEAEGVDKVVYTSSMPSSACPK